MKEEVLVDFIHCLTVADRYHDDRCLPAFQKLKKTTPQLLCIDNVYYKKIDIRQELL